ncbi:MAG: arsenate reductase family protein [Cyclobacteriaceae bacterium]|nr:arsenate reductase family protein [Cyclobacteriaceae bacterium]
MHIYHNPRCGKSRQSLAIIQDSGKPVDIIEYLKNPPTENELREIISLLKIRPKELIRHMEEIFIRNYKGKSYSDDEWIKIMVENPILIERPIVVDGKRRLSGGHLQRYWNY